MPLLIPPSLASPRPAAHRPRGRYGIVALLLAGLAAFALPARSVAAPVERPPNIVILFVDNVGYGDIGCYGNAQVKTPRTDRLAAEGVRCTDFYIGAPSCTPSRGALLTARHPERTGLNWQLKPEESFGVGLPHREKLFPQYLKPLGYATGAFGKWNIGFGAGGRPTDRGFDEFFGHASGNIDYYTHVYNGANDLRRGTEEVVAEGYSTDLFADAACDFVRRHRQQPFFLYVPFNAAHFPNPRNKAPDQPVIWQAPAEALAAYGLGADEPDEKKRYHAVLTALDTAVGRILDTIDQSGLRDHTIVVWLSDNGAFMLPGRGLEVASNKPLRDGGVTVYEGGVRVPCIVRWPGRIRPGTVCREMLSSMDLLPMAVLAAGGNLPDDIVLDGRDPTAALAGQRPSPHEALFFKWRQGRAEARAVRAGQYKLVEIEGQPPTLYDLEADIGETSDVSSRHPQVAADLQSRLSAWLAEMAQARATQAGGR